MAESGWFNDPDDPRVARWFDGYEWTDHTIVKAEWGGPGAPPPPAERAGPDVGWVPDLDEAPPLQDPSPDPTRQLVSLRHPPSNIAKVTRRYRRWPLWGRIIAPAVVVVLLFAVVSAGDGDGNTPVDTTTASTISIDDAVGIAVSELNGSVSPLVVRQIIQAICANDAEAAAFSATTAAPDPQATANLIGAAGKGAVDHCPTVAGDNPTLLNRIQGRAQALLAGSTTSTEPTSTTVAPAWASSTTTKKPTTTTKAPTTTKAVPATTTTVAPTTPVEPEPSGDGDVSAGAPCSPAGASGYTSDGVPVTCATESCSGEPHPQPLWRGTC